MVTSEQLPQQLGMGSFGNVQAAYDTGINGNAVKLISWTSLGSISRLTTVSAASRSLDLPMMERICAHLNQQMAKYQWLQGVHVATCRVIYIQCN
jgi:hypothetical protein